MHRRQFLALTASALAASPVWAKGRGDGKWARSFGDYVRAGLATAETPGMGVAIVDGGGTQFSAGYGYADVARARRVTPDTVFQIASVSKTVTATAMMMLWQDGAFRLDDAIAPLLDFPLAHPKFPGVPVTFRHLFTHTSGISDAVYYTLDFTGKTPPPLREFLRDYLAPGGKYYDPAKSWSDAKPGTAWDYCNVAVALLGYLAGRVNPDPLDVFTRTRLFAPLGLKHTSWRYEGVAAGDLADPYEFADAHYRALPRQSYPDWPAGLLCTSANDYARTLSIYTDGGRVNGRAYLKPDTIATMLTPDAVLPDKDHPDLRQGLTWFLSGKDGRRIALHSGGDPGAASLAAFDVDRHVGALAFANITPAKPIVVFQKQAVKRMLDRDL